MTRRRRWIGNLLTALATMVACARAVGEPTAGGDAPIELLPPLETIPPSDYSEPGQVAPPAPADRSGEPALPDAAIPGVVVPLTEEADEAAEGLIVPLNEGDDGAAAPLPRPLSLGDTIGYDTATGNSSWLVAHDNRFGIVSLESYATLPRVISHGLVTGLGIHFLDGPIQTDMPPRLYDFSIGYQVRRWVWQNVGFDVVARVGAFSDFETTARKGVRYPGHAVAFFRMTPASQLLLGADVLDRDDISLLPVFGAAWKPYDNLRIDAVFPRPSAAVRIGESDAWAFVAGQLGGGTWAIERAANFPDNATYRDLRLSVGVETYHGTPADGHISRLELGYVFARELTYRSGIGDLDLDDALLLSFNNAF
jgi:hypothetical protein